MNPRFETINGKLCMMLEKPIPLTKDAKFPCVVRLIQDDSPMGRYNKWNCEEGSEITHIRELLGLPFDTIPYVECNDEAHISHYEILGYPVADGSKEWALYQMMQGANVIHRSSAKHEFVRLHGNLIFSDYHGAAFCKADDFLKTACADGWQLYEPEPFANVKVGDWVEVNANGVKKQGKIMRFCEADFLQDNTNALVLHDVFGRWYGYHRVADITRKLSSSEVIVNIGCLSGTIGKSSEPDRFLMWHSMAKINFDYSIIKLSAIDATTRELVESLLKEQLKAQEEE